jgi:histidine triad (HIT) family protein
VNDLSQADGALISHLFTTVQQVAIDQGLVDSGYRVVTNSGKDAGQVVFHLHFHVIGGKALNQIG